METYKRNQVEDAIAAFLAEDERDLPTLATLIKRLIDTDRKLGLQPRSEDPADRIYAFFSGNTPGKGTEVKFSEYEAFAVCLGVMLWHHRWTQEFVVKVLRRSRKELERRHPQILKGPEPMLVMQGVQAGDLVTNNVAIYLTLVSGQNIAHRVEEQIPVKVCSGMVEALKFKDKHKALSWSLVELVVPAKSMSRHLARTTPSKRGRA